MLSGHSAGGALVTVVGGIVNSNPDANVRARLKGVMLLDPVENADNGMATNLPKLADKPVLTSTELAVAMPNDPAFYDQFQRWVRAHLHFHHRRHNLDHEKRKRRETKTRVSMLQPLCPPCVCLMLSVRVRACAIRRPTTS